MNYQLTFSNLPFKPDRSQVIYVEGVYDEQINSYIHENYSLLRREFEYLGYEFIYLPMLFKDKVLERKVRYYAPYLESKIIDNVKLRSNYLLNFLSQPEVGDVVPSFLFNPIWCDDKWTFSAWPVQLNEPNLWMLFWKYGVGMQENSSVFESSEPCAHTIPECKPLKSSSCKKSSVDSERKGGFLKKTFLRSFVDKIQGDLFDDEEEVVPKQRDEVAEILENLQKNIQQLRLRGVALGAIHEFIDKQETISNMVITEDLRIFLPAYNNLEIVMSAQRKALYFLFLNHPEGIVLQRLEEYHKELMNYYRQTNGGVVTPRMEESIKRLETYGNNQLNVVITRIREAFCSKFDERLARHYLIAGERGQAYKIALDRRLVIWADSDE